MEDRIFCWLDIWCFCYTCWKVVLIVLQHRCFIYSTLLQLSETVADVCHVHSVFVNFLVGNCGELRFILEKYLIYFSLGFVHFLFTISIPPCIILILVHIWPRAQLIFGTWIWVSIQWTSWIRLIIEFDGRLIESKSVLQQINILSIIVLMWYFAFIHLKILNIKHSLTLNLFMWTTSFYCIIHFQIK